MVAHFDTHHALPNSLDDPSTRVAEHCRQNSPSD